MMSDAPGDPIDLLTFPEIRDLDWFAHGVTTRVGGVSHGAVRLAEHGRENGGLGRSGRRKTARACSRDWALQARRWSFPSRCMAAIF